MTQENAINATIHNVKQFSIHMMISGHTFLYKNKKRKDKTKPLPYNSVVRRASAQQ